MNLYLLKETVGGVNHDLGRVFYRCWSPKSGLTWTGVPDRAALFMDHSAAQEVADELWLIGEEYSVISYEDARK